MADSEENYYYDLNGEKLKEDNALERLILGGRAGERLGVLKWFLRNKYCSVAEWRQCLPWKLEVLITKFFTAQQVQECCTNE